MRRFLPAIVVGLLSLSCVTPASAGPVVNSANINGLRTFQDLGTGLIWADLDNFFALSYNQMVTAVTSAGFTVANRAQVQQLLDSLPLEPSPAQWDGYKAIMGDAPNRELIWGAYIPESATVSWAYSFQGDTTWSFEPNSGSGFDEVPNGVGSPDADMNIWAFRVGGNGSAAPEPSSLALGGVTALLALAGFARRRKL